MSFGELLEEVVGEVFGLDSRMGRTVVPFLCRPGRLTTEFLAGRRLQYSSPLRLYLLTSFAYFLALAWVVESARPAVQAHETAGPAINVKVPEGDVEWSQLPPARRRDLIEKQTAGLSKYGAIGTRLRKKLGELVELDEKQIDRKVNTGFTNKMPKAMFFLLPVFALLLKGLYLRSGKFYIEHVVFALHFHAFCFLVLLIPALVSVRALTDVGLLVILGYLLVALHRVYGQSWGRTFAKFLALVTSYGLLLLVGLGVTAILTLFFE